MICDSEEILAIRPGLVRMTYDDRLTLGVITERLISSIVETTHKIYFNASHTLPYAAVRGPRARAAL